MLQARSTLRSPTSRRAPARSLLDRSSWRVHLRSAWLDGMSMCWPWCSSSPKRSRFPGWSWARGLDLARRHDTRRTRRDGQQKTALIARTGCTRGTTSLQATFTAACSLRANGRTRTLLGNECSFRLERHLTGDIPSPRFRWELSAGGSHSLAATARYSSRSSNVLASICL